jgi:hypothetical protein
MKTQKSCKMASYSEMIMKICPVNSVDLTWNNLDACGPCSTLAIFTHKRDKLDLIQYM